MGGASMRHGGKRRTSRGFTLIEILVVIVLIAIAATLVTVKMQPDDRALLREEAIRLAALLTQARDEAVMTGSSIGWRGANDSYRFYKRNEERLWQAVERDEVFHPRALPPEVRLLEVEIGEVKAPAEHMLVLSASAANPAFRILIAFREARLLVRADPSAAATVENVP
jgi:general secretion pathway protein H